LGLPLLETGSKYQFELNDEDLHNVNSVLSTLGNVITQLIDLPEWLLQDVKFSKIMSQEVSNIYNKKLPEVLKRAIARTNVDQTVVWNFLVAIQTGKVNYVLSDGLDKKRSKILHSVSK